LNYETFYQEIKQLEKAFQEKLTLAQKGFRNVVKDSENGDLRKLAKDLADVSEALNELAVLSDDLRDLSGEFDSGAYMENGDFAKQMVEYCQKFGVDVNGEAPTYEIFPFKVRIDAENQDLYVNRKKVHCVRPLHFVRKLKTDLEKYTKSGFNLNQFLNELATAYDTAIKVKSADAKVPRTEYNLLLKDLYNYLAPTAKARRDYDMQNYAYDIARLYANRDARTKNGRGFELGSTRHPNKLIRILDQFGNEHHLSTVRFFAPESESGGEQ